MQSRRMARQEFLHFASKSAGGPSYGTLEIGTDSIVVLMLPSYGKRKKVQSRFELFDEVGPNSISDRPRFLF